MLGFSEQFSPIVEIKSAKAPETPLSISTSISGRNVLVQWVPAFDNYDEVTRYEVEFLASDNSWR
jgi:hypothetical protein